jgi:hypothetical protein
VLYTPDDFANTSSGFSGIGIAETLSEIVHNTPIINVFIVSPLKKILWAVFGQSLFFSLFLI